MRTCTTALIGNKIMGNSIMSECEMLKNVIMRIRESKNVKLQNKMGELEMGQNEKTKLCNGMRFREYENRKMRNSPMQPCENVAFEKTFQCKNAIKRKFKF